MIYTHQKNTPNRHTYLTNPFINMKKILTLFLLLSATWATAQTIAVQGVLRDPKGRTVDDGYYEVVFSIYDQAVDGTALWSETHPSLATKNGLFVAKLGTYHVLDIAFDTTYYLGIAIEGRVEISPRMELSLAPYAMGVFGKDNYFPGIGDVRIKDSLSIAQGSVTLGAGSMKLGKGDLKLDSGNLTLKGGDIIISKEGAGISFADGTKLSTAFGGTAANLSNDNSVIIAADTDEHGVGSIDLNIGDTTHLRIDNAGRVNVRRDVLLDSGQLMAKTGNDLGFGHWNPADSTYSEVMSIKANGTVVFSGNVKVSGTATADEDLVNLGTLNSFLVPNIPDTVTVETPLTVGSQYGGGTVFANQGGYAYIYYQYNPGNAYYMYPTANGFSTAVTFGSGYDNSQQMKNATSTTSTSYMAYNIKTSINGFSDWFIPSYDELKSLFQSINLPNYSSNYYWTSSWSNCGAHVFKVIRDSDLAETCVNYSSSAYVILVRRVSITSEEIQYADNSTLTVGALKNYLPVVTQDPAQAIGSSFGGGKVFANDDNYTYVAYYYNSSYYLGNNTVWTSGTAVGDGYANTQSLFQTNSTESNSSYWEYYMSRQSSYASMFNNQTDWYIPSSGELELIFQNLGTSLSLTTGTYYLSSSQGTCSTGQERLYYYGGGTSYSLQGCYNSENSSYRTVFVRRVPRTTTITADDNDFVTVGFLLERIAELEAKIEAITVPAIGTVVNGGTVFYTSGSDVYVAYEYNPGSTYYYNYYTSAANPTTFGSGYSNTQNIIAAGGNPGSSYIEGIVTTTINGYSDWFIPSSAELQTVFTKTDIGGTTSNYYWSSSHDTSCSTSTNRYGIYSPDGNASCSIYYNSYKLILVRKYAIGQ